uniref:Uncharacterized protein n=1 Tax=Oryza sativa subsp. japonica TaxID=39947 RepID=Q6K3Y5_ORYSJ|nr:hypothetical protein [Oryza sativa Japonica Group]
METQCNSKTMLDNQSGDRRRGKGFRGIWEENVVVKKIPAVEKDPAGLRENGSWRRRSVMGFLGRVIIRDTGHPSAILRSD